MSDPGVRDLAAWASRVARAGAGELPWWVRDRAVLVLLDDLAAAVGAGAEDEVAAVGALASRRGPVPEATVLAGGGRAERGWAAFANGVATSWLELDEGYRRATCHGGLYAVPAAVAECEAEDATLGAALTAIVVGYEVATRAARAYPAPRPPVLHPHATLAPLGAATAVAAARGYDPRTLADTVTAAATLGMAGPFSHATSGALIRNAWPGMAAWTGITAADLATAGMAGAPNAFSEVFTTALGHEVVPTELTAGLPVNAAPAGSQRYAIEDGYHKVYACCQYAHAAVEAARTLRTGPVPGLEAGAVAEVCVQTHPLALALDDADPANVLAAKFSVPHAVAAVLVTGSTDPDVFSGALLSDPRVAAVRRRVRLAPHPDIGAPPHDRPARVTVTTRDGAEHTAEVRSARGGPDRPLTTGDLLDKWAALTRHRAPSFAVAAATLLDGTLDPARPLREVLATLLETTP